MTGLPAGTEPVAVAAAYRRFSPLVLAVWLALASGMVEALARYFERFGLHRIIHVSPNVIWMAPLVNLVWFLPPGLLLLAAHRKWPDRCTPRVVWGLLLFLAVLSLLLLVPQMAKKASALLALGIAVQGSAMIARRIGAASQVVTRTLAWLLLLAAGSGLGLAGYARWRELRQVAQLPEAAGGLPNVLLIIWDTVRDHNVSAYSYPRPTSPVLAAVAHEGVRFSQAVSTAPWTLPSHASMFTGRFPHEQSSGFFTGLDRTHTTLAEALRDRGYLTAGFVANLAYCSYEHGLDRGFDHYEDYLLAPGEFLMSSSLGRMLVEHTLVRRVLNYYDKPGRKSASEVSREFLRWSRTPNRRPFFAFLNYFDAHAPYLPPANIARRFVRDPLAPYRPRGAPVFGELSPGQIERHIDAYDAGVAYMDEQLGLLLDSLNRRGILDRTLLIVASDHGEHLGDHGRMDHRNSLYRQLLEVPLVLRYPPGVPRNRVIDDPVSLVDLPATVLDLVDAQAPTAAALPGRSLARYWSDSAGTAREPYRILSGYSWPTGQWAHSVIAEGRHYIRWFAVKGQPAEELYDLALDPLETQNLVGSAAGQAALPEYRRLLDSLLMRPSATIARN